MPENDEAAIKRAANATQSRRVSLSYFIGRLSGDERLDARTGSVT